MNNYSVSTWKEYIEQDVYSMMTLEADIGHTYPERDDIGKLVRAATIAHSMKLLATELEQLRNMDLDLVGHAIFKGVHATLKQVQLNVNNL